MVTGLARRRTLHTLIVEAAQRDLHAGKATRTQAGATQAPIVAVPLPGPTLPLAVWALRHPRR